MGPQTQSDVILTCGQDKMWGYQVEMGPFVLVTETRCFITPLQEHKGGKYYKASH